MTTPPDEQELAELIAEIAKIDAGWPNYATWDLGLPAGHWRAISARLASLRAEVARLRETLEEMSVALDRDAKRWEEKGRREQGWNGHFCKGKAEALRQATELARSALASLTDPEKEG